LFPSLLVVGLIVLLLLWKLPKWQVARSQGVTIANRFDRENEARKTLAQIVGGAFLLAGLYSSVQTTELSRQGQITDRFTKAIEQLGAVDAAGKPRLDVRLGGIYALERIARDSDRDHPVVMEVLTAYVREHAPVIEKKEGDVTPIGADVQAILTVIGRREDKYDSGVIDLRITRLRGADLDGADLSGANLNGADLSSLTQPNDENLAGGAQLTGFTKLEGAYLRGADLNGADLSGALVVNSDLSGAYLHNAVLRDTRLGGTNLRGTHFYNANLNGAYLNYANLNGADLSGADLSTAVGVTQDQVNSARGNSYTKLPEGLNVPSNWSK
jgi:uncharacterized protein YjbI with pentapeptide repeats